MHSGDQQRDEVGKFCSLGSYLVSIFLGSHGYQPYIGIAVVIATIELINHAYNGAVGQLNNALSSLHVSANLAQPAPGTSATPARGSGNTQYFNLFPFSRNSAEMMNIIN